MNSPIAIAARALMLAVKTPEKLVIIGTRTRAQQLYTWKMLLTQKKFFNAQASYRLKKLTLPNKSSITVEVVRPRG